MEIFWLAKVILKTALAGNVRTRRDEEEVRIGWGEARVTVCEGHPSRLSKVYLFRLI